MSERDNEPHTLEIVMASGPSHVTIFANLKEADDRSKAIEARREDWIRMRPDAFGLRVRFPRGFSTGTRVYPATPAQLAEAKERAATEAAPPTEAVVGKPAEDPKAEGGNGKPAEPEPEVKQIKVTPVSPPPAAT